MQRRSFLGGGLTTLLPRPFAAKSSDAWLQNLASEIGEGVRTEDIAIIYNSSLSAEAVAATELRDFLQTMTHHSPQLVDERKHPEIPRAACLMIVGRTREVQTRIANGTLTEPGHKHAEAYFVQSFGAPSRQLIFLGGTGIATLYAVYHYLEECCHVGFFWDGDHIPKRNYIPVTGIQIEAQPRFSERMCFDLPLYWYVVPWWDWEDWRKYLDWTLKSRFNILSLWGTPGEDVVWERVWKELGVKIKDTSYSGPPYEIFAPIKYGVRPPLLPAWREFQRELDRKATDYVRARGMRTLVPALPGVVPPEFVPIYPEAQVFQASWNSFPKQHFLHPTSSMYVRAGKAFLENYLSTYGTDHMYWIENYMEYDIDGSEDLQQEVRREIAGANFKVVNEVDPKGVGVLSAWTYLANPVVWTKELAREQMERVPADRLRVLDQLGEVYPMYREYDSFFGHPSYFGVSHSFGGTTFLHGNMDLLADQVRRAAQDVRCIGFSPMQEAIRHNYFYTGFLDKLGWNPSEVDLPTYTRSYAIRRYGEAAAPAMVGVLEELLASVYTTNDLTKPLYWTRRESQLPDFHIATRSSFIPHLRRAMEKAIGVQAMLKENPFYLHDLNDIARQYLTELFTVHFMKLILSWEALEESAFEKEAQVLDELLASIERLLSCDDFYWMSPSIRKARTLPGAPQDVDERARDILTLWAGKIRDYASRDYYELVRGYYRPRVRAYLDEARLKFQRGQQVLNKPPHLDQEYDAIEKKWVTEGFPLHEQAPDRAQVVLTVEDILNKFAPV